MFGRGKIGIQIKRFSFPRKIVEFSPCNGLLDFIFDVFLKRHGFASNEKEIAAPGCRGKLTEVASKRGGWLDRLVFTEIESNRRPRDLGGAILRRRVCILGILPTVGCAAYGKHESPRDSQRPSNKSCVAAW